MHEPNKEQYELIVKVHGGQSSVISSCSVQQAEVHSHSLTLHQS